MIYLVEVVNKLLFKYQIKNKFVFIIRIDIIDVINQIIDLSHLILKNEI